MAGAPGETPIWYTAAEAAERLGVKLPTIYAYVSRGQIRSEQIEGDHRKRRYSAEDVEQLVAQRARRREPQRVAQEALDWGAPVLDSAITHIADGALLYRGRDVLELARAASLREVTHLLWDVTAPPPEAWTPDDALVAALEAARGAARSIEPIALCQVLLPIAEQRDFDAFQLDRETVATVGWRVLAIMTWAALGGLPEGAALDVSRVEDALSSVWAGGDPEVAALLRAALILCADHELNVSTFSARCAASAGATPYGAVNAGISALRGRRHGGATLRVQALFDEARSAAGLERAVIARLRRGDSVPGFGHRLYPDGDPRAGLLFDMLAARWPDTEGAAFARASLTVGQEVFQQKPPTIDLALTACARALDLPYEAPLILFALGRVIGWIAHTIEQYDQGQLIRPRARYTGP